MQRLCWSGVVDLALGITVYPWRAPARIGDKAIGEVDIGLPKEFPQKSSRLAYERFPMLYLFPTWGFPKDEVAKPTFARDVVLRENRLNAANTLGNRAAIADIRDYCGGFNHVVSAGVSTGFSSSGFFATLRP